jgi:hypothetical protein
MVSINVVAIIAAVAVCIPSAIVGFAFWVIERKLEKRDKDLEEKERIAKIKTDEAEKRRQENELMTLQCVHASLALGEATAKAVQRIPDAHCNGDMDEALKYASDTKHAQKEFIERAGIISIYSGQQKKNT